jgi:D-alanyl-D-alanine carboxypeptidase (penicillin-binding protein 5/6)
MKLFAFLCVFCISVLAFAEQPQPIPANMPAPPIAAKNYLLIDYNSGQVLLSQNADQRIEPASLTKLMTAYIVFSALRQKQLTLTQTVPVSDKAWHVAGSRMFIEPNKPVTVEELTLGMIVQSGNDACIALAEAVGGSEEAFVQMMNKEAQRLGLKDTHFANATGLPNEQHYSTAYDLSLLSAAIIRDFPDYYQMYSLKEYKYNRISQSNRNRLLWIDPYVDGVKTGHTENAGFCLVASAKRNTRRLLSVVLGTPTDSARATESQKLLNFGFQFYDSLKLYQKDQAVSNLKVWKGSSSSVKAGFTEDFYVSVAKGYAEKLKATLESYQPLVAPISAGQQVGVLKLSVDDKPFAEYPVYALENIGVANFLVRAWDSLRLIFK